MDNLGIVKTLQSNQQKYNDRTKFSINLEKELDFLESYIPPSNVRIIAIPTSRHIVKYDSTGGGTGWYDIRVRPYPIETSIENTLKKYIDSYLPRIKGNELLVVAILITKMRCSVMSPRRGITPNEYDYALFGDFFILPEGTFGLEEPSKT